MLRITYDPNDNSIGNDAEIDESIKETINVFGNDVGVTKLSIGSELAILRFRLAIARGEIDSNKVEFWFKNKHVEHRSDGTLVDPPKGFCDLAITWITELTKIRRGAH